MYCSFYTKPPKNESFPCPLLKNLEYKCKYCSFPKSNSYTQKISPMAKFPPKFCANFGMNVHFLSTNVNM